MDTLNDDQKKEGPSKRHALELSLEFKRNYARETSQAEIRNLSLSGALIKTTEVLKPSEKIHVFLTVSGRRRKLQASVVWIGGGGVGIKFNHFNNRDLQIVDDIIYFATEKTTSTKSLLDNILSKVS